MVMRIKKGVLKNLPKFTGQQQVEASLKKRLRHRCFPVTFPKYLRISTM